ncbi:MAG: cytochrome c family protein [Proteobacteria bacterium]|nr:cytochrome c family protein [Pseudomonadota bacterium]
MACAVCCSLALFSASSAQGEQATYVGTKACSECHEEQFENFEKFAKKSHSDRSIKIMASDLTVEELQECFACHTTGYGQPGGFVSFEETPDLGHAGCEVCHGPGSAHVEEGGDPELIKGSLALEDCETCHNAERVGAFNFKPLLYGGAH